ncbi:MAG: tRNA (guanosine(46)-N7)-methyltransferase TrmB [Acidobacteriota bacterium]
MAQSLLIDTAAGESTLADWSAPLDLDRLAAGDGPWEVELGFGKGKYLLRRSQEDPERRFLGIEMVTEYYRMLVGRARKRGVENLVVLRGEALYALSAVLPRAFASDLHVYFPDPWPKARHHKRRLFDGETVDLVLGLLAPGGRLWFATDFLDYGELVAELLGGHPQLELRRRDQPWPEGPRTNYEAKYEREGRPILRLEGIYRGFGDRPRLHPAGEAAVLAAPWQAPVVEP